MKKFKKITAACLTACMMSTSLAACGQSGATGSTAGSAAGSQGTTAEETTITYWYWADNDDYAKTMEEMVADFNATNGKGITVVAEQQPWDGGGYSTNLLNVAIGGGPAYSTQTLSVYVYNRATALDLGYASAISIVLTLLLCLVSVPYLKQMLKKN